MDECIGYANTVVSTRAHAQESCRMPRVSLGVRLRVVRSCVCACAYVCARASAWVRVCCCAFCCVGVRVWVRHVVILRACHTPFGGPS